MKVIKNVNNFRTNLSRKAIWFIVFVLLSCIPFTLGTEEPISVEVGVYQVPPLVQYDSEDGYSGLVIDVLNDIAGKENWEINYTSYSWAECLDRLQKGSIDMLCLIADLPERRELYDFNRESVYLDWGQIWTRPKSDVYTLTDLQGKTVAGIKDEVFSAGFKEILCETSLECQYIELNGYHQLMELLYEEVIEAAVLNRMFDPEFFNIDLQKTDIIFSPISMGFGFPKNAEKNRILIPKLDKHLKRMKANSDSVYRTAMDIWIYCDNAKVSLLVYYLGVPGLLLFLIVLAVHRRMRRNLNHQAREIKTQSKQLDIMSQKRFEAEKSNFWLFNTISDGLVVFNLGVDGIPGIITEVNKQTCLILGRDETKLKSMKIIELVDSSELERIPHLINQLRIRRDILFPIKLCSADGSTRNVEIHANLIDVDGQWRALSVIRDVTERINLEHEFIEKHTELQEQFEQRNIELQRMNQELEMFAGTVSHDLQSPLRTIEGIVERVRIKCSNGDFDANEEINRMVFLIHRVNGLVTGILEYNRLTRRDLEMTDVELSQICSEVLLQLDGTIRDKNAEVIIERPMPRVIAHPNTLLRCIQNLLTNALKFVEYGKIPKVVLRAEHRGDVVRLWIIDNGIGIAPEYQDRIFQVFERLHGLEEYTGNGLGLAIVKRAVERMKGRFGLISEEGEGSRFWIELPVDPTDP